MRHFYFIGIFSILPFFTLSNAHAFDIASLVNMCESCHGSDGNSQDPEVPIIAGFSYEGFLNTIDVFREGDRIALRYQVKGQPETVMNEIAQKLSDEEADALAKYFSQRPFIAAQQPADTEKAKRGEIKHKQRCEKCHSNGGTTPEDDAAILAGQWTPYLRRQIDNILSGKREVPRSMLRRIRKLSEQQIDELLQFYAAQGRSQ